jgi:16S rRNA (guanine527-N7)-methyltransferase
MDRLQTELKSHGIDLRDSTAAQLEAFLDALYAWNERKNLTRVPREDAWCKHLLDSLLFADHIPTTGRLLDLGTGAGIPAWPIAAMFPELQVEAVDSNGKMIDFLLSVPRPNLAARLIRAEEMTQRESFDLVTGRAVAPFSIQAEISAPFVRLGGRYIPMRTPSDESLFEAGYFEKLGLKLVDVVRRNLPDNMGDRANPIYEKVSPTPPEFPRLWAMMKRNPLS